ncbi:MAG: squalene/phytoene synthase family protein [Streptosporangiales bacterium]|nr:squalene/phytoene synthase family protein [Streptosporangiales bacterium]
MDTEEAYAECERITWAEARNFAYGIRLLPPHKRRALAAVYAYARRIDDIGDGDLGTDKKSKLLEEARTQVHALDAGDCPDEADAVLVALTDTGRNFDVSLAAFGELIDGCLADVNEATYETFDDLLYYCRCVAGSIGRLSLGVYGAKQPERQARMADDLGVALQITNILRDVREDYLNGRVYLPREDLEKFGCEITLGGDEPYPTDAARARFASLVDFEAARAREWYASGLRLLATIDRRSAACTGAMAGIYRRLLERIAANPAGVLQARMSLPAGEKALVAAQSLAGIDRWRHRKGAAA